MAETASQRQLRRREAGWGGSRRRNRDPRYTNRIGGGTVRASQLLMAKPVAIKGPGRRCGGCRGRLPVLPGEIPTGVLRCPSTRSVIVGWQGTAWAGRPRRAMEKSAEAVVPAGSKGRREGPNAKSRRRTRVLARIAPTAANPARGLRAMDAQGEAGAHAGELHRTSERSRGGSRGSTGTTPSPSVSRSDRR
jgi:hypothetical protein